jgi:hypothetical protein
MSQKKGLILLQKSENLIKLYSDLEKLQKKYDETTKDYPFEIVYRILEEIENLNTIIKKQEQEIAKLEYKLQEEEDTCGTSAAESYRKESIYQPKNECCALLRDDVTYNSSHNLL